MVLVLAPYAPAAHAAPISPPSNAGNTAPGPTGPQYTIGQTLSDLARQTTIAFDGLAFLTGSVGADSFFPPGKGNTPSSGVALPRSAT